MLLTHRISFLKRIPPKVIPRNNGLRKEKKSFFTLFSFLTWSSMFRGKTDFSHQGCIKLFSFSAMLKLQWNSWSKRALSYSFLVTFPRLNGSFDSLSLVLLLWLLTFNWQVLGCKCTAGYYQTKCINNFCLCLSTKSIYINLTLENVVLKWHRNYLKHSLKNLHTYWDTPKQCPI